MGAHRYIYIDLTGPFAFDLSRGNTKWANGTAGAQQQALAVDPDGAWSIKGAWTVAGGYRLALMPQAKGPGGAAQTITILTAFGQTIDIPEWGRSYRRCSINALAPT